MSELRMRFRRYRDNYSSAILEAIDRVADDAGLTHTRLGEMLNYQMNTGGKRLRAVLPLMVAEALDVGADEMVAFGACCELIHNATLVHDDLQDGDRLRRGQPAVWVRFGAAEAINLGDAMLMLAPRCLDDVDVGDDLRWQVARRISQRVLDVIGGQQSEFELTLEGASYDDYERMVAGKTSGLFALPMVETARLCSAPPEVIRGLEQAAHPLGVLFQIQDDILDLYGEKGRDDRGGDIREGKISALAVAFVAIADDDEVAQLQQILEAERRETADEDVRWVIDSFRDSGALDEAINRIARLRGKALNVPELADYPRLRGLIEHLCDVVVEPIADVASSSPFDQSGWR